MARRLAEIQEDIRSLSEDDKEALLHLLITDLEQPMSEEIERAWIIEANKRMKAYRDGSVEAIPADEVFTELRSRLSE